MSDTGKQRRGQRRRLWRAGASDEGMGLAERPEPTPKVWANAAEFLNQEFGPAPEMLVVTLND